MNDLLKLAIEGHGGGRNPDGLPGPRTRFSVAVDVTFS